MATLYEYTTSYADLLNYAQSIDFTDEESKQTFKETLDALDGSIEEKVEGTSKIVKELEYSELAVDTEMKRLSKKKKALKNNQKRLKDYMQYSLEQIGKDKVETDLFTISIRNNPPKVTVTDTESIPENYWKQQEPKLDKTTLKQDLLNGTLKDFKGAHIEQERSLQIR